MPLTRRDLLTGLSGAGTVLMLPPTVVENAKVAGRSWALDASMLAVDAHEFAAAMERVSARIVGYDDVPYLLAGLMGPPTTMRNDDGTYMHTWSAE